MMLTPADGLLRLNLVVINTHGDADTGNIYDDISFPDDPMIDTRAFFYGKGLYTGIISLFPVPLARRVYIVAAQCWGALFVRDVIHTAPNMMRIIGLSPGQTRSNAMGLRNCNKCKATYGYGKVRA